jgi:hypothetical protein
MGPQGPFLLEVIMSNSKKKATKKKAVKKESGVSKAEFTELKSSVDSLTGNVNALVSMLAKDRPANSTRNVIDTDDAESFGQDHERVMQSSGPALESLDAPQVYVPDGPINPDKCEEERFMQDVLTITVHESTNPNDEPLPCITVNGKNQYFIRGKNQDVKRMFVERLLRMKHTTYTQRKQKDGDGNDVYVQIPHTTLKVPFAILHDPAGRRGQDWYNKIRQEA